MSEETTSSWPSYRRMEHAGVGAYIRPEWRQALNTYRAFRGLPPTDAALFSAAINDAVDWWNERADREIESFAFPKVPVELRPLFLAVSNVVMEELREPGHRADLVEVTLQNRIRHAFEAAATPDSQLAERVPA